MKEHVERRGGMEGEEEERREKGKEVIGGEKNLPRKR